MRTAAALLFLLLSACAPQPGAASRTEISPADMSALRDCATITPRCTGFAGLAARLPSICSPEGCFGTSDAETLVAVPRDGGAICGFRAVRGPTSFAIFGIWHVQADGTRLYRNARFLHPAEAARLRNLGDVVKECDAISV
ncbi:hypothetical protein [Algicella marina]|uniref:Lipoprotein n=1 Tax=Algicella marina TaxID=2683284 RepID=A0A6P1SYT4_9RHOB|nr:hypothetical protein [Algicella marina]QHQ35638.1 hypothetical protein GO499_10850 [Algicella marina]